MIINGDCLTELDKMQKNSVDAIVTDPPYELNFMGKGWDNAGVSFKAETWEKCLNVLKPGGYLLAFGGSRTFHRIACAIEDAGFEIRDTIMWLYGSGFPKSMNIGLAIDKKNGVDNRTGNIKNNGKATNSGSGCYNCNNGKDNSMKRLYEERIAQNRWNATILDPFMGSGSTGKAIEYENKERDAGYKFIGIEKDADYCRIAEARIEAVKLKDK